MGPKSFALVLLGMCLVASPAASATFYLVDFSADTPGMPPQLDTGPFPRWGPSDCLNCVHSNSEPVVESASLGLVDQPVVFEHDDDATLLNEQLGFQVGSPGVSSYSLSMDLATDLPDEGRFTISFDLPNVLSFHLRGGQVFVFIPGGVETLLFPYASGVPLHLDASVDLAARTWSFALGEHAAVGSLIPLYTDLASIRLILRSDTGMVAADNIHITPEPGTLVLLSFLAGGVLARRLAVGSR